MVDVTELAGHLPADLLFVVPQLLQLPDTSGQLLFIILTYLQPVMIEGVAHEPDTFDSLPDLVVTVYLCPIIAHERDDEHLSDDTKERLILMEDYDVIHEPVVVLQALICEPLEAEGKILRPLGEEKPLIRRLRCHTPLCDIPRCPVGHLLWILSDIEEPLYETVEVSEVYHSEELCHLDAQGSTLRIGVYHSVHKSAEFTILELIINLLMQQLVIHQRKIMMDIEGEVEHHLSLRASIKVVPYEA